MPEYLKMKVEEETMNKILAILAFIVGAIIMFFGVMFILVAPTTDPMMISMSLLFVLAGLFDIWFGYDRLKYKKVEFRAPS